MNIEKNVMMGVDVGMTAGAIVRKVALGLVSMGGSTASVVMGCFIGCVEGCVRDKKTNIAKDNSERKKLVSQEPLMGPIDSSSRIADVNQAVGDEMIDLSDIMPYGAFFKVVNINQDVARVVESEEFSLR